MRRERRGRGERGWQSGSASAGKEEREREGDTHVVDQVRNEGREDEEHGHAEEQLRKARHRPVDVREGSGPGE